CYCIHESLDTDNVSTLLRSRYRIQVMSHWVPTMYRHAEFTQGHARAVLSAHPSPTTRMIL
ncbi:unnamed protein product, partial [Mycena citricolor]